MAYKCLLDYAAIGMIFDIGKLLSVVQLLKARFAQFTGAILYIHQPYGVFIIS